MKKIIVGLLLLAFSLGINAAELKKADESLETPILKLESLKGKSFDLSEFKDKIVLVQFWATYCTSCRVEMPSMNTLRKELEAAKVPFEILAVNMGETKAEVQKFVDEVKPEFPVLLAPATGEDMQRWNVFAAPSNFVIDTKGKIRYTLYGGVEWDSAEITKTIKDLAAEAEKKS